MSYHASRSFRDWRVGPLRATWHRFSCVYDDTRHLSLSLDWVTAARTYWLIDRTFPRCGHAR